MNFDWIELPPSDQPDDFWEWWIKATIAGVIFFAVPAIALAWIAYEVIRP